MSSFAAGWRIQRRVIGALMIRELVTRFGRENIGFLWMMVEPLLFAVLVGLLWRFMKGPEDHGISAIAFVATGYIPLTFFRNAVQRSILVFTANSSLMYHRQVKILDFVTVRVLIEFIGGTMAFIFIGTVLYFLDEFPIPSDVGAFLLGWSVYCFFVFSLCLVLAPISEMSEVLEKMVPVVTYIMIPFSGTFNMFAWLSPGAQRVIYYSPFVHAMELLRYGIFGPRINAQWDVTVPLTASLVLMLVGLGMCRRIRRELVVE